MSAATRCRAQAGITALLVVCTVDLSVQLTERKQTSLTAETLFTAGKASMVSLLLWLAARDLALQEITGKHSNLFGNAETYSLTASVGSLFGSNWGAPAADMTVSVVISPMCRQ